MTEPRTPALTEVETAYTAWSAAYIERFASADLADPEDRALIRSWADALHGPVLDAGCGPGHWAAFLHDRGVEVEGVDATAEFVAHASRSNPDITFRVGDLRALELADGSLGGVLAWFSLIHTDPVEVPAVLRTFAAAVRPGGGLLLGFFTDERLHSVRPPGRHRMGLADRGARARGRGSGVRGQPHRAAPHAERTACRSARRATHP